MGTTPRLLVVKTGAAGDVVRTTVLLHLFRDWEVHWFTAEENKDLIRNLLVHRVLDFSQPFDAGQKYDLVICLEDDAETVRYVLSHVSYAKIFGSFLNSSGGLTYTEDSAPWFDMGLTSTYGPKAADLLKLENRKSYQQLLFESLGYPFSGQPYIMPEGIPHSDLIGDIAVCTKAGNRWPIKNWHYFNRLVADLSSSYAVNVLPLRKNLVDHIADIRRHKFVISPDSLPMHIALGFNIPCLAIFTCTSPWEIHDYGILTKVISDKIYKFFYHRGHSIEATTAIPYDDVYNRVIQRVSEIVVPPRVSRQPALVSAS